MAGVDRIDIRNFHEALQAVANFLEAAAHATAYGQEARNQAAEVADLHKEPHPQTACFLSWSRKDVQLVSVGS